MARRRKKKVYYVDSSALSKLYLNEPGSEPLQRPVGTREKRFKVSVQLCVSRMAFPETLLAIRKQMNVGNIEYADAVRLWREVLDDFVYSPTPYAVYEATEVVAGHAAALVIQHGLRAYDAVHLSTAMRIRAGLPEGTEMVFVSADRRLNNVARQERFTVYDPTLVAPAAN
ncbi:MAG TPA: type II toxin-antitoxin system VapC family toxin [Longimicrobium sp.]|nr:type II toxin-antitoxin system VapC family toxin [Longimicrobium sp.]